MGFKEKQETARQWRKQEIKVKASVGKDFYIRRCDASTPLASIARDRKNGRKRFSR